MRTGTKTQRQRLKPAPAVALPVTHDAPVSRVSLLLAWISAALLLATIVMSSMFWLRVLFAKPAAPSLTRPPSTEALAAQASRLFGTSNAAQPVAAPTRYRLYGVIAGGPQSVALLGVDGQAPHAIGIGKPVAPGVILHKAYFGSAMLLVHSHVLNLSMQPAKAAPDPGPQRDMGRSQTASPE